MTQWHLVGPSARELAVQSLLGVVALFATVTSPAALTMCGRRITVRQAVGSPAFFWMIAIGSVGAAIESIIRRQIATDEAFRHSTTLRALGRRWTAERLDTFLTNPTAFASCTSVRFSGLTSSTEPAAPIQYLRDC